MIYFLQITDDTIYELYNKYAYTHTHFAPYI